MRETRSDGELLRAIAADTDRRAFEELYRRYAPWLTARLRGRCADAGVVDDVVQETFLAIWHGTASYREEGDAAGSTAMTHVSGRIALIAVPTPARRPPPLTGTRTASGSFV